MSVNSLTDFNRDVRPTQTSTPAPARASSSSSSAKADDPTHNSSTRASTTDVIEISPQARAASQAAALNASAPAQNFSVGSGYSSGDKAFDQVKQDMRALFDARSKETGIELNRYTPRKEEEVLFGDIKDRRALFAVYGDETGTFTKDEKNTAYHMMWQQKNDAEFGPLRIKTPGNPLGPIKGTIDFLNQASPEEKATMDWVEQRAVAQINYENSRRSHNIPADPFDPYGQVNTGDANVDSLILRLVSEGVANYDRSLDKAVALKESDAYAQAQRDFTALLAAEHTFTFTQ